MKLQKGIGCLIMAILIAFSATFMIPVSSADGAEPSVVITAPTKKSTYTVYRGASNTGFDIKYTVKGGTAKVISFKSNNEQVAKVGKKTGKVTILSAGTARITLRVKLTTGVIVSDRITLNVVQRVTSIKYTLKNSKKYKGYYYITKGSKKSIRVSTAPSYANDRSVRFYSSRPKVAKVDRNGRITALQAGSTKISIVSNDGGVTTSFKLKVINKTPDSLQQHLQFKPYKGNGTKIVKYARKFIGTPYVYGGNDLTTGVDCSGFTSQIFKKFGYNLNRTANDQIYNGTEVDLADIEPGDILFFDFDNNGNYDHVGIYSGSFMMIHASTSASAIKEAPLGSWLFPVRAVRIIK